MSNAKTLADLPDDIDASRQYEEVSNSMNIIKEWADRLNGRQYLNEISKEEEEQAKADNVLICFAASDDNIELRGAIDDEIGAWGGVDIFVFETKAVIKEQYADDIEVFKRYGIHPVPDYKIFATWQPEGVPASWLIRCGGGCHFDIYDGEELFCRGVVIQLRGERVYPNRKEG